MSIRSAVLAVLTVALATGSVPAQEGRERVSGYRERAECMNHLRQLGGLLGLHKATGRLMPHPGSAYLLQLAPKVADGKLGVFLCPADFGEAHDVKSAAFTKRYRDDWKAAPCSYRGPDAELLAALAKRPQHPVIIACDANGPDGTTPHHPDGVCVLWSNHRVQFLTWEDIEGSGGKPCAVGPDSPDPRLRRLVTRSMDVGPEGNQTARETPQVAELRAEIDRLRQELHDTVQKLETEIVGLRDKVRQLEEKLELITVHPAQPSPKQPPRIDAVVTSVDPASGLVLLSVGLDDGVRKGMEFTVYRGNQYVAKVLVDEVRANVSTATSIKELERMAIKPGDKATTRF